MSGVRGFLKFRIESLKNSDYTAEFSEHEFPPIDLDKGHEMGEQAEKVDSQYRTLKDKLRAAVKALGRTVAMLFL